jgi:CemA family
MSNSFENANNGKNMIQKIGDSFLFGTRWFGQTPERALGDAYQAALMIIEIENKHFFGKKVAIENGDYSQNIFDCFQADVDKYLNIIKRQIGVFKLSRNVVPSSNYEFLEKLSFIDEILTRYQSNISSNTLALSPLNEFSPTVPLAMNQPHAPKNVVNGSQGAEYKLIDVEPVTQKKGVLPRSIGRTFDKIRNELDDQSEDTVVQNYRNTRRNTKAAIRTFLLLLLIPLLVQQISKQIVFFPVINHYRLTHETPIFINFEVKEEALGELQTYEHELKFTRFLEKTEPLSETEIEEKMKEKANELAEEYKRKGSDAISNIFADFIGLISFGIIVFTNPRGIGAIKSLLNTVLYDLSDSAKAFLIILFTDIFVGFHSPHGWEVILEGVSSHLGLPANRTIIFLFIATFPVILDTFMKYWIFRYLNQISPSAVATLKNMNE